MNELQRLAYLDALGIDSYISRRQLPAAAPSRRLRIVRPVQVAADAPLPVPPATESEPAAVAAYRAPPLEKPDISPAPTPAGSPVSLPASAKAAPIANTAPLAAAESPPLFSVAASYLGGYYWLDEVPRGRELGESYQQLLQGICFALGLELGNAVFDRFNWPMHHNRQLDQGAEAARHGFEGFVRARLEQRTVQGVVLLGEPEGGWYDPAVFSGLQLVTTVSAWRMLKQPELKNVAWSDLQGLRQAALRQVRG